MVTRPALVTAAAVVLGVAWLLLVPLVVVDTVATLVALATAVVGAGITVGRAGMVDLSLGAVAGVGAYGGAVTAANLGLPAGSGLVLGGLVGGVAGGLVGALIGRVGRIAGALGSLAVGAGLVALLEEWPDGGATAGFHAVPMLTGGPRTDLLILAGVLGVALVAAWSFARSRAAAQASVAAASPAVAASLAGSAPLQTALAGAVGGAVVGVGGAAMATAAGSVIPAGFGLPFTATLVVAGLLAGAPPWGPLAATLVVWGVPVVGALLPGEASATLAGGIVGLLVLAFRRGRPLFRWRSHRLDIGGGPDVASTAQRRGGPGVLEVTSRLPSGQEIDFRAAPGEVVALVGPNGSGKSTLLARIGGQLRDDGGVRIDGRSAPRGARRRAGAGVARTWQTPPEIPEDAAERAAISDARDQAAYEHAAAIVGREGTGDLLRLAARRPSFALLDEPGAHHPPTVVRAYLRHLASSGAAVVVAEHRPDVVAVADHVIRLEVDRD